MKRPELTQQQLDRLDSLTHKMGYLNYAHGEIEKRKFIAQVTKIKGITRQKANALWEYEIQANR